MDFRILGPLEVLDEGRRVALGGSKQRSLLALLLLHVNEWLSADSLIDELWGGRPPATASKTLQVHVSGLRKALGAGAGNASAGLVVTREHGYELRLDPDRLDACRFERLVAEGRSELDAGRPERGVRALEVALSLWRGVPLGELSSEPFARQEVARLEDGRVAALEQVVEAKLALGGHDEVVGPLESLISEYPYRERLRAQLMLALYRSDRQADALHAYQNARRTLVEELGIEPGERLRELERAILAQDPELLLAARRAPVAAERVVEAPRSAFVGRVSELAELIGGLDDAFAGQGRLFLLGGEPGIGKSRLAEEVIERARARGARVLIGRCWEAGGAPAYWPWVQSLRAYVRESDTAALRSQLGAGAPELAQIIPELRQHFPDLPEPPSRDSEGARFRLFDAASSLLLIATQDRPVVLVLDDLHAADEPSLLLLRFVAREIAASRLLVVCAYRNVDPRLRDPLGSALSELVREPQTAHIVLAGLSERNVAEYIELSTGVAPAAELVSAIHTETEGNPLFVAEVVRLLDAEDRIAEPDAHMRIPPGLRAVIGQRVGRLSERCRKLLVRASVMGREFELDPLARLGALGGDDLLDVLDEAMAEGVVGDVPGSPGRLRFGHALIRDTLYDELSAARRLRLHEDAGHALEAAYSADLEPHLTELAHHFVAAGRAGAGKAVEYAGRAGHQAASQLAYEEAIRLYGMALELVEDDVDRCELLLALGDARARAGDTAGSKQTVRRAAELAGALRLPEQLARAALGYGGRLMWEVSRDDEYLMPLIQRALAALADDDSALRARLLARLAGGPLRDSSFAPERKASLSRAALAMARRVGDPMTLAYALDGYVPANESPDNTEELLELSTELLNVAIELGDKERAVDAHEHRLNRLIELGEMAAAKAELEAMAKLAQELRQPAQKWLMAACNARQALLEGRFADAARLITEAHDVGESAQSWNAAVTYRLQLYVLRREQGRLEQVEESVRRSVEEYPTYPIWQCVLAHMAAELGHETESRQAFAALATDDFAGVPFEDQWLVSVGFLAETARSLGDPKAAVVLYRLLLPYADRVAVSYPEICIGSVSHYLGILATTMAREADAERHFQAALQMNEQIGARPWLAHTQHDYARMLLARESQGDRDRALELLADARSNYHGLGMNTWAKRTSVVDQPTKRLPRQHLKN